MTVLQNVYPSFKIFDWNHHNNRAGFRSGNQAIGWLWFTKMCVTNLNNAGVERSCLVSPITFYTPRKEVRGGGGYIGFTMSVCLSVCLSVCPSVCPLTFRVRPVASAVQDGFFPYLVQMITSMGRCVACDDLWPCPISSRSFGLDLENRVRSLASTVLDGFFLYLAQMITIIRVCVACYVFFQNLEIWIFGKFLKFFGLDLENKIYSSRWILSIFGTNDH